MKKILLAVATLAITLAPAAANAAQCRDSATGKFAKCGAPGAVPASQYVPKGKPMAMKAKSVGSAATANHPQPVKAMMGPAPAAAPKPVRCKTTKGKFVKCGTPGAVPA